MPAITFETASKRMKPFGTIDKFISWNKPCNFTFIDGTTSSEHSPRNIFRQNYKSKPENRISFKKASKRTKRFGTIDEDSYLCFNKPCRFTFIDGTVSTSLSPKAIKFYKYKSKPRSKVAKHNYESAAKRMKPFGTIVESSFEGWHEPCKFTFIDGTTSKRHTPNQIENNGYKTNPKPHVSYAEAAKRLKPFGTIDKSSFIGWNKPCNFTFKDGNTSDKHTPRVIYEEGYKSKPKPHVSYAEATKRLKPFGTIDKSSFRGMGKPCNFTFIDGTTSKRHSPSEIKIGKWKSLPKPHSVSYAYASKELKPFGTIDKSSFRGMGKPCNFTFIDGTTSKRHSPSKIKNRRYKSKPKPGGAGPNTKFLYITDFILHDKVVGHKIGIAADVTTRCGELNEKLRKGKLVTHKVFKFRLYKYCKQSEDDIKKLIRAPKSVCKHFSHGQTEVYAVDQLKPAMKIIRKYKKERKCVEYTD